MTRARLSGLCDSCLQPSGAELRNEAMERAEQAAPENWKEAAATAVENVAKRMPEFIPDDVWAELTNMGWTEKPPEGRALGPVMMSAARRGVIQNSGRVRRTTQARSHAAPVTVWLSRIVS